MILRELYMRIIKLPKIKSASLLILLTYLLCACSTTPRNIEHEDVDDELEFSRQINMPTSAITSETISPDSELNKTLICPGDIVKLQIVDGEQFNGLYKITAQGEIELPYLHAIKAAGLTSHELQHKLQRRLVQQQWFHPGFAMASVSIVKLSVVQLNVDGAVFQPGKVSINHPSKDVPEPSIEQQAGDFSGGRDIAAAINAAGGIRPDADLTQVYLKRGNNTFRINLQGIVSGQSINANALYTPSIMAGDEIFIPSTGIENIELIRPSQITPPGLRVFMSNLTQPASHNANAAIGNSSTRLPYGSTFLEAAISANCVGGTHKSNATRDIVFVTRHYGTKQPIVVKRNINQLLKHSDNEKINLYVMPNDALACYDSRFTNFRDVAKGIAEIFSPFFIIDAVF